MKLGESHQESLSTSARRGVPCSTKSIPLSTSTSQKGDSMEPQEPPLNPPLKCAILTVASWYPESFHDPLVFLSDMQEKLSHVTPMFQKAFHHYSGTACY